MSCVWIGPGSSIETVASSLPLWILLYRRGEMRASQWDIPLMNWSRQEVCWLTGHFYHLCHDICLCNVRQEAMDICQTGEISVCLRRSCACRHLLWRQRHGCHWSTSSRQLYSYAFVYQCAHCENYALQPRLYFFVRLSAKFQSVPTHVAQSWFYVWYLCRSMVQALWSWWLQDVNMLSLNLYHQKSNVKGLFHYGYSHTWKESLNV